MQAADLGEQVLHRRGLLARERQTQGQIQGREGAIPCPVWARPRAAVRAVLGPQDRFFAPEAVELLTTRPFQLTDSYDRMGVRLRGPRLEMASALNIPSEPILRGSVQVSGDGGATVLLADHQTTGGYPKIATLIGEDIDGFAQLRPHDFAGSGRADRLWPQHARCGPPQ